MNASMKAHLLNNLKKGVRYDGRKLDEFRKVTVERSVAANAEGSARVTIGDTVVLAGVKLGMGTPYEDTPESGNLMVNAELIPMASPDFEVGPPSVEAIELARVVDRGIRESEAIDVKKLCIKKGEQVWSVSVDIIAINNAGNLLDAASIAALAALQDTKLPEIKDGVLNYKKATKETLPIDKEPLEVTVYLLGEHLLVDPLLEEQNAADARLTIAVMADDTLCAMQKGGAEPLTKEQVDAMMTLAVKKVKEIRKAL